MGHGLSVEGVVIKNASVERNVVIGVNSFVNDSMSKISERKTNVHIEKWHGAGVMIGYHVRYSGAQKKGSIGDYSELE